MLVTAAKAERKASRVIRFSSAVSKCTGKTENIISDGTSGQWGGHAKNEPVDIKENEAVATPSKR